VLEKRMEIGVVGQRELEGNQELQHSWLDRLHKDL
jgi:hypothetical protein